MTSTGDQPIGIFDSGVGGLTVLAELRRQLPAEDFIYLGDTARLPYGNKSAGVVTRYAFENTLYLLDQGVKMVVIACNTATAGSLDRLQTHFRRSILGVIEPGAHAASEASRSGRIGVIGTTGTIASGAYEKAILNRRPGAVVHGAACPLLVPLAEEGMMDHPASGLIIRDYLQPLLLKDIDVLLLGCTHYPILRKAIAQQLVDGVRIIDSAGATAQAVREDLVRQDLLRNSMGRAGTCRFLLSDRHDHFRHLAERFLDGPVPDIELVTY